MRITLTCPNCATRYFAPDSIVGEDSTFVECSGCGFSWCAAIETPPTKLVEIVAGENAHVESYKSFRRQQELFSNRRMRMGAISVWLSIFAVGLAIWGVLTFYRFDIVQTWPSTYGFYQRVGVHVDIDGFSITNLTAQPGFLDKDRILTINGQVKNITNKTRQSKPVIIEILDEYGVELESTIVYTDLDMIPPSKIAHFSSRIHSPTVENILVNAYVLQDKTSPDTPHRLAIELRKNRIDSPKLP